MKLLIRNLDRAITEKELKVFFQEFGAIQSCSLVMDQGNGLSKGFGFVEMPNAGEAKAAIKNLNNKTIGSNKIRVKKATPNAPQAASKAVIPVIDKKEESTPKPTTIWRS